MENVIICGEAASVMAGFPAECIDLTVTSPPYDSLREYQGYVFDFEAIAQQLYRVTKPGGVVVWVVGDATVNGSETGTSFKQALRFKEIGFNLHDTMIYGKKAVGACGSHEAYWQAFEFMFVFSKGKIATVNRIADMRNLTAGSERGSSPKQEMVGTRLIKKSGIKIKEFGVRTNIWFYDVGFATGDDKTDHPAPFPEQLTADHIRSWSNEGDVVLDCFMGSGTVAKAARILGRKYIGIDISQTYCDIATERLSQSVLDFK